MGERTQYAPGTFCWMDLSTSDPEAAKSFYGELLGWEAEDVPLGGGPVYSMMRRDGKDVAAIALQPQQQRDAGVLPAWSSYVSVESADATATRAQELGATVTTPPFDVTDAGRMAAIQDPQGAIVMLWEPRSHIGATLVNATGALVWNQLSSPDIDASAAFYRELFGWRIAPIEGSTEPYLAIENGEAGNGGIRELNVEGVPPHWIPYFGIDDVEQAIGVVDRFGGFTVAGPIDIGIAKIAIFHDPQDAPFALYAGLLEP